MPVTSLDWCVTEAQNPRAGVVRLRPPSGGHQEMLQVRIGVEFSCFAVASPPLKSFYTYPFPPDVHMRTLR